MDSPSPPVPNINPQLPTSSHSASHDDKEIHSVGSFENDHQAGVYTLCWENIQEFERWKLKEEEKNTVEIIKKQHFKLTALTEYPPLSSQSLPLPPRNKSRNSMWLQLTFRSGSPTRTEACTALGTVLPPSFECRWY